MPQHTASSAYSEPAVTEFKSRILLIDDQRVIIEAVRGMVREQSDVEFHFVNDAASAVDTAKRLQPTVILQDLVMPHTDGFSLIRAYRGDEQLSDVPVIVLSAREDPKLKAYSFAVGANDYLVKLPDRLELLARVRYHSAAYISRRQRDEAFRLLRASQKRLASANIELQRIAAIDSLTGIANRRRFDEVMRIEWQRGQRSRTTLTLLMCDIDNFKMYNDRFGHLAGDLCLKRAAAVMTGHLKRPADLAARFGGEEFAIVLPDTKLEGGVLFANACRTHLEQLAIENPQAPGRIVTMSVGVASVVPAKNETIENLIERADRALYRAKDQGRNRVVSAAPEQD
jgi:two-component system chemotaxis family response regulator WspR